MIVIKNSEELKKHLNQYKDLIVEDNVNIQYQVKKGELRDVKCWNLTLEKYGERFDFYGLNFTGWNFNGKNISYNAFFNCYGKLRCESIQGRRKPHAEPVALGGIEIIKQDTIEIDGKKYDKAQVQERLKELKEIV